MIDTEIIKERDANRTPSNQGARQLSSADQEFYHRRAAQETEAAAMATCNEARLVHEEMARAYRLLCTSGTCSAGPHTAPEMSIFQFAHPQAD